MATLRPAPPPTAQVPSADAIYQLVAVDVYGFDRRRTHIANLVRLPPLPPYPPSMGPAQLDALRPHFVVTLSLPDYPAALLPRGNGPSRTFAMYFTLPEGFDAHSHDNQAALDLVSSQSQPVHTYKHTQPNANTNN